MTSLRVAVHAHSTWSYDGTYALSGLARTLRRRRFDAVLMSEHDRGWDAARWREYRSACARATGESGLLVVPGIEYSDAANEVHVLTWGVEPFLGEGLATDDLLAAVRREGAVAVLAHPGRRGVHARVSPEWVEALVGIEIWNRKSDGWAPSAEALALHARHPGLVPFVGLDVHTSRQLWPLAMRLGAAERTEEAVVAALRAGRAAPEALGLPARRLVSGPPLRALRAGERLRRPVARRVRRALNRARAAPRRTA